MRWQTEQRLITCSESGVEHLIQIALPLRFEILDAPPVVIALDGGWTFGTIVDNCRVMSMQGEAPEAVVVGVSFVRSKMSDYLADRARWYTPTPYVPPAATGVRNIVAEETGHASVLRHFLGTQLLPHLETEFGVGDRWFFGHSFSGLFGLTSLFAEPELFKNWILASPSIWWDDRSILGVEQQFAGDAVDLPANVFMSAGGDEAPVEAAPGVTISMIDDVEYLASTLVERDYPSLRLSVAILGGETHHSTIGAAASRGLRALV